MVLNIIDLNENKKHLLFIMVEKVLILFLLYAMLMDFMKVFSGISCVNKLDGTNIYANSDSTTDEQITQLFDNPTSIEKANQLYDYIEKNFVNYSYWEYESPNTYNGNYVFQASTDKYFFDLYNIDVIEGRNFTEEDLNNTGDQLVPVIVGYGLKDKYQLGKEYTEVDLNTGNEWKFKVIEVLRRNESYPSLFIIGLNYSLDYRYIRLIDKAALKSFANIDMALSSKVIFSDDENKVKKIEQLSNEYNLFDMNYRTVYGIRTINCTHYNFIHFEWK